SADRRSRGSRGVSLSNGDRGSDAIHLVDLGFFNALEELPRVCGEGFDVPPLAFGIDGVKGEGRLSRAAHARDDRQRIVRYFEVDILEVMDPHAPDNDAVLPWRLR